MLVSAPRCCCCGCFHGRVIHVQRCCRGGRSLSVGSSCHLFAAPPQLMCIHVLKEALDGARAIRHAWVVGMAAARDASCRHTRRRGVKGRAVDAKLG